MAPYRRQDRFGVRIDETRRINTTYAVAYVRLDLGAAEAT